MNWHPGVEWLVRLCGVALVLLSVSDVFMTVLFARAGTGPISQRLGEGMWAIFRRLSRCIPAARTRSYPSADRCCWSH
jgi:hypothetical protein